MADARVARPHCRSEVPPQARHVGDWAQRAATASAVGTYGNSSGAAVPLFERWNGTSWTIVASPSGANGVLCTSTISCVAVGAYYDVGSDRELTLVERWDGVSWAIVPSPNPPDVRQSVLADVSCSTSNCFAVGSFTKNIGAHSVTFVERWNGTSWVIVRSANPTGATDSVLSGVSCTSTTNCFAVGYGQSDSGYFALVERRR